MMLPNDSQPTTTAQKNTPKPESQSVISFNLTLDGKKSVLDLMREAIERILALTLDFDPHDDEEWVVDRIMRGIEWSMTQDEKHESIG